MNSVLEQLKEISSRVMYAAEARELESVLDRIADAARELARTKYAALGVPDGLGGLQYFKTSGMTAEQEARIGSRPEGKGLIGAIMRERKLIRLDDMSQDPRSSGIPSNHPHMTSFLGAPVIVGNHLYGMLYLSDKIDGTKFTLEDEALIETLAGYAALAIAGAQLSQNQSRLRLLEERERIGMELHDGVIQSLYGIGMQVDIMRRSGDDIDATHMSDLVDNLNDVIEDIRMFIGNLRRRDEPMTIQECIHELKNRLHPPQHIDFQIDAPDTIAPFSASAFESICLIVNEAMSNAIRHAEADTVRVSVDHDANLFNIKVQDNGRGFEPELANSSHGLGLRNMKQRARLYGGVVNIDTQPDKGTSLTISIPTGAY